MLSNKNTTNNITKYVIRVNILDKHPYFVQMSYDVNLSIFYNLFYENMS